jgi:hypothetical protein
MSIFDEKEMKKRTCPFAGHGSRERIIHEDGNLYKGVALVKGIKLPITVRHGPVRRGDNSLFGMAISFQDRTDVELKSGWVSIDINSKPSRVSESTPLMDTQDDGDIMTLGKNNGIGSMYFNDMNLIKREGLSDNASFALIKTAFNGTGMIPNFAGLPHITLDVDSQTRAFVRYTGLSGIKYIDDPSKTIPFNETTHWELCDTKDESVIMTFQMSPSLRDGKQETGSALLFKHNLEVDESPPPCITSCFGITCNIVKLFLKSCCCRPTSYKKEDKLTL